ncbi:hypothetical protein AAIH49_11420, partial [Pseudomonas aeruginosa]|nr:hypothetical protein [Pseudomonas aeruginosa]MBN0225705.1 hypothetical protein [Pseudomonas aeruginosa]MBN0259056.1 hypothetical protein [Pseudomonas aeruginosa]MBN0866015.1 hypothetical protein [Pseudomonas aeruginosa]MWB82454.1 hypothetical protein [Pseudomonas aeruginosa]
MLRLKASPALLFGLLLASAASFAAQPPAGMLQPLRGTIQQAADDHLQLKARNGPDRVKTQQTMTINFRGFSQRLGGRRRPNQAQSIILVAMALS